MINHSYSIYLHTKSRNGLYCVEALLLRQMYNRMKKVDRSIQHEKKDESVKKAMKEADKRFENKTIIRITT